MFATIVTEAIRSPFLFVFLFVLPLVAIFLVIEHFGIVPAGRFRVTTLMGKYNRILGPGLYALRPLERLVYMSWTELHETIRGETVERKRRICDFPSADDAFDPPATIVRTADKQEMTVNGVVWWNLAPTNFDFFERTADPITLMHEMYKQSVKNVVGRCSSVEIASSSYDIVATKVRENLAALLDGSGIRITRVGIQAIDYPERIAKKLMTEAEARQTQSAEQLRFRDAQEAELVRQEHARKMMEAVAAAAKAKAEHDAELLSIQAAARVRQIKCEEQGKAEAEASAMAVRAKAEADATTIRGQAEAASIRAKLEAEFGTLRQMDPQANLTEIYKSRSLAPLWNSGKVAPNVLVTMNGTGGASGTVSLSEALLANAMLKKTT